MLFAAACFPFWSAMLVLPGPFFGLFAVSVCCIAVLRIPLSSVPSVRIYHMPPTQDDRAEYRIRGALQHAHYFWDCPVAQAVIAEVCAALRPHVTHLHRSHVWLCIPPCPAVCPAVWRVVCLAACAAMNEGRKHMWKHHLSVAQPTRDTRRAAVLDARRAAVRAFWCNLSDFVRALPTARRAWLGAGAITQATPFIAIDALWPARTYKLVWPPSAAGPELEA